MMFSFSIFPGDLAPLTVFDKDSVKVILHFAQNKPRDDVVVMVLSIMSTKATPLRSIVFQAAVPKVGLPLAPYSFYLM